MNLFKFQLGVSRHIITNNCLNRLSTFIIHIFFYNPLQLVVNALVNYLLLLDVYAK